jgi:allophanate hydrolase subunit 1
MAGGLATTTTIVRADFWRLGQCRPGDMIRFKRISWTTALALRKRTEAYVASIRQFAEGTVDATALAVFDLEFPSDWDETILYESPATAGAVEVKYRQAGDSHIHVTYGPMTTSVLTRAHIQHRVNRIEHGAIPGIISVIGTTRAYCVQFDTLTTTQSDILQRLIDLETSLGSSSQPIPSRIFRFPVLLDDPVCKATVDEYARTLRDSAVYLPDNMEYVAKANGVVDGKTARQSLVLCPQ